MDSTMVTQRAEEKSAQVNEQVQRKGISGSTIKIIAIVAMLIDHIGAVIVERLLLNAGYLTAMSGDLTKAAEFMAEHGGLLALYLVMRQLIGRLGFPIFCFLLIEGFMHTRNVTRYALRLGVFALISEIPFDLAFNGKVVYWGYQNVFFTLLTGLLVMIAYRAVEKSSLHTALKMILDAAALVAGAWLAEFMNTDYGAIGIVCIMALYIFRKNKVHQIIAGCLAFLWEVTAPLAFIPIAFYNGKRGLKMKYFFYAFYPVHLFILYLIAHLMGLA